MANGMDKAMATINSVARKGTKTFATALPLMSIAGNVAIVGESTGWNPAAMLTDLSRRYTGFDPRTGVFNAESLKAGTGSLIVSVIAGKVLKEFL